MKRIAAFLLIAGFWWPAEAQITISESNIQAAVGSHVVSTVHIIDDQHLTELGPIINASGPNQTYDFTPYTYTLQASIESDILGSSAGTPGENDAFLNQANYVSRTPFGADLSYGYFILNNDGYYFLGSAYQRNVNGTTTLTLTRDEPGDITHQYPMTYETSWNETINFTSEFSGTQVQAVITNDEVVDGWGTLITPMGTQPTLRLRKTHTVTSGNNAPVTTITYLFITNSSLGANITTNELGEVARSGASYTTTVVSGSTRVERPETKSFQLFANYPNPLVQETTISFSLEAPGHVSLRLFDLTGREVGTLVDGFKTAGSYRQEFDARDLPNGVYIYKLQVDGATAVRQLVVLK
jgi:Secretion system C-terminal sorting domain